MTKLPSWLESLTDAELNRVFGAATVARGRQYATLGRVSAVKTVGENFEVISVPTLYPAGGAKQLIRVLTGKPCLSPTGPVVWNVCASTRWY